MFRDRVEAGRALAEELAPLVTPPCVVAAVPRGGVAVALPIAERLRAPLTVVYARKLTSPRAPELAFGALDEDGESVTDPATVGWLKLDPVEIREIQAEVRAEIQRRMALYRVPPLARYLPGATVVLVDDGLATGLTMGVALLYARRHGAREVIVATPCAAVPAAERFRRAADRLVALVVDENFRAVGAYYRDFTQVSDEEVLAMLARAQESAAGPAPDRSGVLASFKSSRGLRLVGRLHVPAAVGPRPCVVFLHDRDSAAEGPPRWTVTEELCASGIGTFLLDVTGHGESEGAPEDGTVAQEAEDLGAALDTLETLDEVDAGRLGVVAWGGGAAAALRRAAEDARIRALVVGGIEPEGSAAPGGTPTLVLAGPRPGGPAGLRDATHRIVGWFRTHLAGAEAGGGA